MAAAVRNLEAADFRHWEPLWQGYLTFYKAVVHDPVTRLTFSRLTGGRADMGGMLAFDGPAAIGMVNWIMHPSCWTEGDYCYLQDLFVDPARRGGGTGRLLIDAVCAKARASACSRVYWLTHETNRDAMALYGKVADRSGFIQYRKIL
jgi:GNAT superfamily N-acetyltransferase